MILSGGFPRFRVPLDRVSLVQMGICALPAMLLVSLAQRTWGGNWLYLTLFLMLAHCVLRGEHARFGTLIVGLIPVLMLLRTDFYYNLPIALLAAIGALWLVISPSDVSTLWANVHIRLMLILTIGYWLVSFLLTGDYNANLRVLELSSAVCAVFLLAGSRRHLQTALVGISLSALLICIALLPYGERLGMASIGGHRIGNPITLGIPLALVITLSIADRGRWLSFAGGAYRIVFGLIAGAFLLLTTSRGAWAVAAANVMVLMCLGKRQRVAAICLLIAVMLAVPLILATQRGVYFEQGLQRTVSTDRTLTQISSGRSDQWLLFPRVFGESPFWGYGPGLGQDQYATYSLLDHRIEYRPGEKADWHSLYLQVGVDAGLIGLVSLAFIVIPLLFCCLRHRRATGEIVPLLGVVGFLVVATSVSAMDAISGVFLGLGFLSTKAPSQRPEEYEEVALRTSILPLTRHRARRYLDRLMNVDATTMGEPWGTEEWLLDLPEKWDLSWFVLRAREPLGFLIASRKESSLHIHRLATAANERHRGFGTQLLGIAARRGRARGCLSITLKVDQRNEAALRFYQRLGFHISDSCGGNLTMSATCQDIVERAGANRNNRRPGFSRRNPT